MWMPLRVLVVLLPVQVLGHPPWQTQTWKSLIARWAVVALVKNGSNHSVCTLMPTYFQQGFDCHNDGPYLGTGM